MKRAILLAAYGAATLQSEAALRHFAAVARERFPGVPVRWAFTSCRVRERMAAARKKTDSVQKALQKLWFEKFTHVAVQPLQTIPGRENMDIGAAVCDMARDTSLQLRVGAPLLACREDVARAAAAVVAHLPAERRPDEDVVLMGHGAKHAAVERYAALAQAVAVLDRRVHVGAMNGAVCLEDILPGLASRRVWLMPLLSVVGRHALEDMAGHGPGSWRSRIEAAGHECRPVLRGTAEYGGFITLWLDHLEEAMRGLTGGGLSIQTKDETDE